VAQRKMGNEEVPGFLELYPVEHVAMEATTSIAPLYRRLEREGYDVHVIRPGRPGTSPRPALSRTGSTPVP